MVPIQPGTLPETTEKSNGSQSIMQQAQDSCKTPFLIKGLSTGWCAVGRDTARGSRAQSLATAQQPVVKLVMTNLHVRNEII